MVPKKQEHIPVLVSEVLELLDPKPSETYLDLTAGYGGHAGAILERTLHAPSVLVDRDGQAVAALNKRFADKTVQIVHSDFLAASKDLQTRGQQFDLILADLGLSSPHLNTKERGFAINLDGPLDMRMDSRQTLTADIIVNTSAQDELTKLIREYGEEPRARRIAEAIVRQRPLKTTGELADVVRQVALRGRGKIHPATKTFQAIRIVINDELAQLEQALPIWAELLVPNGRMAVISFHSLEDRLVKRAFSELSGERYDATLKSLTKKPVRPGSAEIVSNPRARSARLRAAVKINIKGRGPHANSGKR